MSDTKGRLLHLKLLYVFLSCALHEQLRKTKKKKVMCGLKCMSRPEKWAEMSARIAFDLPRFTQVSHIHVCVIESSSAPLPASAV